MVLECKVPNSSIPDAFDIFTMASALGNIITLSQISELNLTSYSENLEVQGYEIVDFYDRNTTVSDFLI